MLKLIKNLLISSFLYVLLVLSHAKGSVKDVWLFGMVSEEITENAVDRGSIEDLKNYFSGKEITLKDGVLDVKGLFSCEVVEERMPPVNYFLSKKSVLFYRVFLENYGVKLNEEIGVITPVKPNSKCVNPFSEFVKTDNVLMLVYKDRAVFYYPADNMRLEGDSGRKVGSEKAENEDNASCIEGSNDMDVVYEQGYIFTCFYNKMNLISAYIKHREKYQEDKLIKLLKKEIAPGKNEEIKISSDFIFLYNWKSKYELEVEIFQPGGVTTLNFKENDEGTTVKSVSSPD